MMKLLAIAFVVAACGNTPQAAPGDGAVTPGDDAALPPADLAMTPTPVDFGQTVIGAQSGQVMTISNLGGSPSGSIFAHFEGPNAGRFFVKTNSCATLGASGTCDVKIVFRPLEVGVATATFVISDGTLTVTAPVSGSGIQSAALEIDHEATSYDPTLIGSTSQSFRFTIQNVGGLPSGALVTTPAGTNPTEFTLDDRCANAILQANDTCTIDVAFAPTSPHGAKGAGFTVSGTPGGSVMAVYDGQALAPAQLLIAPSPIDLGFVPPGTENAVPVMITNTGDVTSGTIATSLTTPTAFMIAADQCNTTTLNAGAVCHLWMRFGGGSGAPATVGTTLFANVAAGGGSTSAPVGAGGASASGGLLKVTPNPADYGTISAGTTSQSQTLTVTNPSGGAIGPLAVEVIWGQPSPVEFAIVGGTDHCSGVTLGPTLTCTVDVVFAPVATGNTARQASFVVHAGPIYGAGVLKGTAN